MWNGSSIQVKVTRNNNLLLMIRRDRARDGPNEPFFFSLKF